MSQTKFKIKRSWRFYLQIGISFSLSALLLILLGTATNVNLGEVVEIILDANPVFIVLVVLSTLLHFNLSALKWRVVTTQISPEIINSVSPMFYLFYTSLGALFGQFIPLHISTMITRGIGLRLHQKEHLKRGLVSSVYEQGFDVLIPLILAIASILKLLKIVDLGGWLVIAAISLGFLWLVAVTSTVRMLNLLANVLDRIKLQLKPINSLRTLVHQIQDTELLDNRLMTKIFLLAVIRYANLTLRAMLVALAVTLDIDVQHVLFVMPLVQISMLIPLTPGNLGVVEWTWTGILTGLGSTVASATVFGLGHRLLILMSVIFTNLAIGAVYLGSNFLTREDGINK
jgi:glycosyltransferase 2 family protein